MRNLILVVALMTVAVAAFAACGTSVDNATVAVPAVPAPSSANTPKPKDPADDAPRITLADAKTAFDAGSVVFVDTRAEAQFKQERIKGSINIPFDAPESRFSEIPKGKKIIAYCSWPAEHTSAGLVAKLKEKGIENAFALVGGTQAWKNAGYPMEASEPKK